MIVRAYQGNDEDDIQLTDMASKEWGNDDDVYALECLRTCDAFTVIDDKGYKNIICFVPQECGSEYGFFMKDKRSSSLVMKHFATILENRGRPVWTLSQVGQDKMHKFLKMVKICNCEDKELWVKL